MFAWFQAGVTMLEMVHEVTHRARKKSRDDKYDVLDERGGRRGRVCRARLLDFSCCLDS